MHAGGKILRGGGEELEWGRWDFGMGNGGQLQLISILIAFLRGRRRGDFKNGISSCKLGLVEGRRIRGGGRGVCAGVLLVD